MSMLKTKAYFLQCNQDCMQVGPNNIQFNNCAKAISSFEKLLSKTANKNVDSFWMSLKN